MKATPTILSEGDSLYSYGDQVEVAVVMFEGGVLKIQRAIGNVVAIHTERVVPNTMDASDVSTFISSDCKQFQFAEKKPPVILNPSVATSSPNSKKELKQLQRRVIGYDIQVVSTVVWENNQIPFYYHPQTVEFLPLMFNYNDGSVCYMFIPRRHVLRMVTDVSPQTMKQVEMVCNMFCGKAPYHWLVQTHEKQQCEVLDFGVDFDGVAKLIVATRGSTKVLPECDQYLFHGSFAEVARRHYDTTLYKLPYSSVKSVYDEPSLGPQTYTSVLKQLICGLFNRYRVKTVKFPDKEGTFYYGFTECGMHFSKTGNRVLNTAVLDESWLSMMKPVDEKTVRRGYVIYGRVVDKNDGNQTLEWVSPDTGLDLLRVYLATNGKSPIFKKLTKDEIIKKMKNKDGSETVASKLFAGIIDLFASNDVIEYVKQNYLWAK